VVADDVVHAGLLDVTLDAQQVVEALIAFSGLRGLVGREHRGELGSEGAGIDHLTLGIAWVDTDTFYIYARAGCIEVLELELAHIASIHGVGPFAAEALYVEMVGSHAYLLVGVEGDADVTMLDLGMVAQPTHGLDNLGDASLVVGSQQGMSVGHDEILTDVLQQFGEFCGAADNTLGEKDVGAVVLMDDVRLDVCTRTVGAGVVVGDEADGGDMTLRIGLQCGVDIAMIVHLDVAEALALEFLLQVLGEDELLRGARHAVAVFS